jgi:penicillin-binding protein 2
MSVDKKSLTKKINVLIAIVVVIFVVLVGRVAYLQLLETERYQTLARENSLRLITISAPRGEIYDRNGRKLVGNRPLYTVSLVNLGQDRGELEPVVERLAAILDRTPEEIWDAVDNQSPRRYEPVRLARDVSLDIVSRIEEAQMELPGVVIDFEPMREYPYGNLLAHVLGYIREIRPDQLARHGADGYRLGDVFGQAGLENAMERELRGISGARRIEVDVAGRPVRSLGVKNPVPGHDLTLTIDFEVQRAAEEALARIVKNLQNEGYRDCRAASAAVIDVRSGAVRALAGHPAYGPEIFAGDLSAEQARTLFTSPERPFLNRAIQSTYPPGSIFKMVVAAAALESGMIDRRFTVTDPGYFVHQRQRYGCLGVHGRVDVVQGIQVSCNTFFLTTGLRTGPENIARMAREFGLGEKTGIELAGEAAGVVPAAEYKRSMVQAELDRRFGPQFEAVEEHYRSQLPGASEARREELNREREREKAKIQAQYERYAWDLQWRDYDTLNMSIGQGLNNYTPLQLAGYTGAIANGGYLYRPYLVQRVTGPEGRVVKEAVPELRRKVSISPETLDILREGMRLVNQPGGTAYGSFFDFPVTSAGKTGTAEVWGREDHGLYVAFAPFEEPEIAVAVVVEHGGSGSRAAAPVARAIMNAYFGFLTQDEEQAAENERIRQNNRENTARDLAGFGYSP